MNTNIHNKVKPHGHFSWLMQRISAAVLILMTVWLMYFLYGITDKSLVVILQELKNPWNAAPFASLIVACLYHGQLGMQVIIEDYVSNTIWQSVIILALKTFTLITTLSFLASLASLLYS